MKVGDLIRDYEFPDDKGIIIKIDPVKGYFVWALPAKDLPNGHISWLPHDYIKKCKVIT